MNLLLDTHSFLWFVGGDSRLSSMARANIESVENSCRLSTASLWEMAIKVSIGRLGLPRPFSTFIREQLNVNAITLLDIRQDHVNAVVDLPFHNRDPFDRMLVAQSQIEQFTIVSADVTLDAYEVDRLW